MSSRQKGLRRAPLAGLQSAAFAAAMIALVGNAIINVPVASAAEETLLVSADGVTYSTEHVLPVFPEGVRLVPGDTQAAPIWVKNNTTAPALLRLDLIEPTTDDPLFAANMQISATPERDEAQPVLLSAAMENGSCTVLSGTRVLPAGATVRVDVRAAMSSDLTDEQAARATADFQMRAVLADADAASKEHIGTVCGGIPDGPSGPSSPSVDDNATGLPATGGSTPVLMAALGAIASIVGTAIFLRSRRREQA